MTFHNSALARLVPDGNYRADDLARVEAALSDHQTLTFVRLPSGPLFGLVGGGGDSCDRLRERLGEGQHLRRVRSPRDRRPSHRDRGRWGADRVLHPVLPSLRRHHFWRSRSSGCGQSSARTLRRPHAQRDRRPALGARAERRARILPVVVVNAGRERALKPDANAVSMLTRLVRYFAAIRFWQDEDSGHWEEQRKVSASSIGTVVAGLEAFADLLRQRREWCRHAGRPGRPCIESR